ncbi:uncharacterized protein LOC121319305 [Polyodon spathula]|uniref:uncharacterized protein LOC121319305 n=1 Tax=Polyodon spathula TaxID=7913 RepID=UPI001B7EF883|nr:uncharacterized protein LOC121319305 [Polyodon spathula]XP_041112536.1 uncharacterized protein LOC121319305 [Polyodon spathula]
MASLLTGSKGTPVSPSHGKDLFLGTVAAASAFLVTAAIVLLCVGCKKKRKTKKVQIDGVKLVDMSLLRQTQLRSISKSDTRLHEMKMIPCNGKKKQKKRPVSMDLLHLPSRRSDWDLRCPQNRQLPTLPLSPGENKDHTYSEVGRPSSQPRGPEDALYESVGGRNETGAAATVLPKHLKQPPQSHGNGSVALSPSQEPCRQAENSVTAEYACVRKVRKADKAQQQQQLQNNPRPAEQETRYSNPEMLPGQRKHDPSRINGMDAFYSHSFPKDSGFVGNGEQYIWKPPEDGDGSTLYPGNSGVQNFSPGDLTLGSANADEISDMYSKVCKPFKKRPPASPPVSFNQGAQENSPPQNQGWSPEPEEGTGHDAIGAQAWVGAQAMKPNEEPSYEAISKKAWVRNEETDPAYESIDANWKREKPTGPPADKKIKNRAPPRPCSDENLYENISDLKQGATTSTTTVFMFNDGIEMYVTGL